MAGGTEVLTRGRLPEGQGCFCPPTVLASVTADSPVAREEVFGPVAPVVALRDEEEALRITDSAPVGLAGCLLTEDAVRLPRLGEDPEVGRIGADQGPVSDPAAPFGGVEESGLGREGGREGGLEGAAEHLETVHLPLPDPRAARAAP